jgi:hypothetical protein
MTSVSPPDHARLALDAWDALARDAFRTRRGGLAILDGPGGRTAHAWPLALVLWAAAEVAAIGGAPPIEALRDTLARYRRGDAYAASPRGRERYFDDNAWLGLAAHRLCEVTGEPGWTSIARELARFTREGEHPRGGIRWAEGSESRNACSTAGAAWLALTAGGPTARPDATRWLDWLDRRLTRHDGLVADRIERGRLVRRAWTYNQGATAAARRLLGRDTRPLLEATVARYTPARLWAEPPAFVAVAARGFEGADDDRLRAWLDPYLARLAAEARDPATGWYTGGGIGSYDGCPTIDLAAVTMLLARRALSTRTG